MVAYSGTLMGLDYGHRRIGVAVGQTVTGTATALEVVPQRGGAPDWARLEALRAQWRPQAWVLGWPVPADGTQTPLLQAVTRFAAELERRCGLPVERIDERLSSHAARELAAGQGRGGPGIDAVAAQLILESWFSHARQPASAT